MRSLKLERFGLTEFRSDQTARQPDLFKTITERFLSLKNRRRMKKLSEWRLLRDGFAVVSTSVSFERVLGPGVTSVSNHSSRSAFVIWSNQKWFDPTQYVKLKQFYKHTCGSHGWWKRNHGSFSASDLHIVLNFQVFRQSHHLHRTAVNPTIPCSAPIENELETAALRPYRMIHEAQTQTLQKSLVLISDHSSLVLFLWL